jgi:hypothetical protein
MEILDRDEATYTWLTTKNIADVEKCFKNHRSSSSQNKE